MSDCNLRKEALAKISTGLGVPAALMKGEGVEGERYTGRAAGPAEGDSVDRILGSIRTRSEAEGLDLGEAERGSDKGQGTVVLQQRPEVS